MSDKENPKVLMKTSMGDVTIELNEKKAPISVANFLQYVADKHYDNTIFHRVIDNFMVQGGGFDTDFEQKSTRQPIKNEADNGLKNLKGSIAMARTMDVHSATAQFFINVNDNDFLDYRSPSPSDYGYCVFGMVTEGMDVIDKIKEVKTGNRGHHQDVPVEDVVIEEVAQL